MATTKKVPTKSTIANVKKPTTGKPVTFKSMAKKVAKSAPVKKTPVTRAMAKKARVKKGPTEVVDSVPTVEQRLKEKSEAYLELSGAYTELLREHLGLKRSFSMVKENYEREKNRLDKVIDASLNNSKALEAITNTDADDSDPEFIDSCGPALCCKQ